MQRTRGPQASHGDRPPRGTSEARARAARRMRRPDRAGLPADSAKEHEAPSAELAADPEAGHSWKESIGHSGSERPRLFGRSGATKLKPKIYARSDAPGMPRGSEASRRRAP
ncbi:unnamed protein product [Prorocentrum cordatum]|uniref:Uncharacterized protein n=2 Tax=Prorocentrum cordatum TaxID=2364126 RepID=A0ABN9W576_9DINO|nr:unnamed protein product [Polarella glacialis]